MGTSGSQRLVRRRGRSSARAWGSIRRSGRWLISRWRIFRSAWPARGSRRTTRTTRTDRSPRKGLWPGQWQERGPTWDSVFQTVEGGLGYWAGNHFRYGPPKFSMNATPQCYDYEVGSPGWSFFYSNEALARRSPGHRAIEQPPADSSRCVAVSGKSQRRVSRLHLDGAAVHRSHHGRSAHGRPELDLLPQRRQLQRPDRLLHPGDLEQDRQAFQLSLHLRTRARRRPGIMGGGAMEINTVPRFDSEDAQGDVYSKMPKLQFPVDDAGPRLPGAGRDLLLEGGALRRVQGVARRRPRLLGAIRRQGRVEAQAQRRTRRATTRPARRWPASRRAFDTRIFEGNVWGLQWFTERHQPRRDCSRSITSTSAMSASPCRRRRCPRKPSC